MRSAFNHFRGQVVKRSAHSSASVAKEKFLETEVKPFPTNYNLIPWRWSMNRPTKVCNFYISVCSYQEVLRFNIAMDYFSCMTVHQSISQLSHVVCHTNYWKSLYDTARQPVKSWAYLGSSKRCKGWAIKNLYISPFDAYSKIK
jgi:hypothetical protein